MAKNFSSREAKELIAKHRALLKTLSDIVFLESSLKLNIKNSADSLAMKEILAILRGIPIDELSRYKKGLRTKPLIDHYYTSIADIYSLSIYNLATIKGVSQDNAYTIKRIVNDIADKTRKETKIKLSIDNKSKESTKLVKDIGFYGGQIPTVEYLAIAMSVIENDYPTYIKMLKRLWDIVKSNPVYSSLITKKQLAMNWDGDIIQKIYDELD